MFIRTKCFSDQMTFKSKFTFLKVLIRPNVYQDEMSFRPNVEISKDTYCILDQMFIRTKCLLDLKVLTVCWTKCLSGQNVFQNKCLLNQSSHL